MRGTPCPALSIPESGVGFVRSIEERCDWIMIICPMVKMATQHLDSPVRVQEVIGWMFVISMFLEKLDKV